MTPIGDDTHPSERKTVMTRLKIVMIVIVSFAVAVVSGRIGAQVQKPAKIAFQPGQSFKECRNCPEMIVIPAGSFMMGSPATEVGRRDNEPQSMVTIARPFAVCKTEVTWDQWEACVRGGGCDGIAVENALRLKNDGTPNPD